MKEELVYVKDEVITPSTVEDTCTVYVQGDVKMENTEIQGNHYKKLYSLKFSVLHNTKLLKYIV